MAIVQKSRVCNKINGLDGGFGKSRGGLTIVLIRFLLASLKQKTVQKTLSACIFIRKQCATGFPVNQISRDGQIPLVLA
jgi:hypothetical protein